jgi:SnoaL-like polyketide cyclase
VGGPLVASDGPRAAFWWRAQGTNTGAIDPPGIPATGKLVEFQGADFHEYRDGEISRLRIVFDTADISRQLGLLPAHGSVGERALVLLQQIRTRVLAASPSRSGRSSRAAQSRQGTSA